MRMLPPGFDPTGETLTWCDCVVIARKDGVNMGFTSHDMDVPVPGGIVCQALTSSEASALRQSVGAGVDNVDVRGLLISGSVTDTDVLAGKYDSASVTIYRVDWTTGAAMTLLRGQIGDVVVIDGQYTAEVRSQTQRLVQQVVDVTSPTCRVRRFGDAQCNPPGGIGTYQFARTVSGVNGSAPGAAAAILTQINCGGGTVAPFASDTGYTGGATDGNGFTVHLSGAVSPAPMAVYQQWRTANNQQSFFYTLGGLTPGQAAQVRLHFSEPAYDNPGGRVMDVLVNNVRVLQSYDIVARAGKTYTAVTELLDVNADGSGNVHLEFRCVLDNAICAGIELLTDVVYPIVGNGIVFAGDSHPTGYYSYGQVQWTSGVLAGTVMDVKQHIQSNGAAVLSMAETPTLLPGVGDSAILTAGCDRTFASCQFKFANVPNFRGEPHLPGIDKLSVRGRYGT